LIAVIGGSAIAKLIGRGDSWAFGAVDGILGSF
jgi:hypothetical protein